MFFNQPQLSVFSRSVPAKVAAMIAVLFLASTSFISGIGAARADTPSGRIGHVYMTLSGQPGNEQQNEYVGLIQSLGNTVGHAWTDGIGRTQTNQGVSLVRVDLNLGTDGEELRLWITPNNLYLRGFTTHDGRTYYFNDFNLGETMQNIANSHSVDAGLLPELGQTYALPYGSNYNSLVNAAGIGREALTLDYDALWNHAWYLQYSEDSGSATATALMFMIQFLSEAVRFNDVYGVMLAVMVGVHYDGVPIEQQELENAWEQITRWAELLYGNQNPAPYNVGPHVRMLSNRGDARAFLRMGIGDTKQVDPNGDWWRTEL